MCQAVPIFGALLVLLRGGYSFRVTDPANIRLHPTRGGGGLWDVGGYPVRVRHRDLRQE